MVDLAAHYGFTVARVKGMPRTARSVTDTRRRVIYIAQRDDLSVRAARSVILQTLGHFALEHAETTDFEGYLRQRIESNYFAAAVLVPEAAAVDFLTAARGQRDLSIEDLKERYYVSYEMAAHRFTNLATARLGIPVHFIRTDPEGTVTKAYENDGIEFPTDADGGLEGARLGRHWGARQAWDGSDLLHYQLTDHRPGGVLVRDLRGERHRAHAVRGDAGLQGGRCGPVQGRGDPQAGQAAGAKMTGPSPRFCVVGTEWRGRRLPSGASS